MTHHSEQRELPLIQQAIIPIAAFAAAGDQRKLAHALEQGLDAGMSVSTAKEVLVQLYAYAGFPRSINALATLMALLPKRAERGIQDLEGPAPSHPAPLGDDLLARGSATQTRLVGQPVSGPLFEFAPAIDTFLKTHLFGDIFERDNLDWQSREVATVAMLSAITGAESQLRSHLLISINTGLNHQQLQQLVQILTEQVGGDTALRARTVLAGL